MAWQPAPESLSQLAACLKDSLSGFDKNAQKQAEIVTPIRPRVYNALPKTSTSVRSAAAIMLKNNVRTNYKQIPESSLALIKMAIPLGIQDKNSQAVSWSWPELLPQLLSLISNENGQVSNEGQEGAMSAMAKICEDNVKVLEREHNGQRPLNFFAPQSELPKVRAKALTAINVFTPRKSQAMLNNIDSLLNHLFTLAGDQHPDVRRQVCHAFVQLVETRPDKLQPHIAGLVDYIITQQKSDDEDLACEAAEFWLAVGEHEDLWRSLTPYLDKIIPVLLECMVYSGEDIALLGGASDDEEEEDREEDIKPQFAKKSAAREPDERWTIRKCSAAALDVFARDFSDPVFTAILPYLTSNLKHEEWQYREAAVLALGAVAEGTINAVTPHLPELVPYLLSLLGDNEPIVRQITCWTLGRYSQWAANLDQNQKVTYFEPMMEGILRKMLDKNKKVQEAAASAFANLEEKSGKVLEPYCIPILQQFVQCFARYKDRNMYILYDCVQTLAENIGPVIAQPDAMGLLMPALIERYQKVSDDSRELFPLLECLSYVAMALGSAFTPYAQPIFVRCVNIIHTNLEQSLQATNNPTLDSPDKDFLVTSLDLLSAIIQSLDEDKKQELVRGSEGTYFELLGFCLEDPQDDVRQSAYALLGDCAKYVFPQLEKHLNSIFPILLKQLDLDNILDEEIDSGFSVVNNACWSAGEIVMVNSKAISPFVPELLQRLVEIISNPGVQNAVNENAAIALGRLGLHNSEALAPLLPTFAEDFLSAMEHVEFLEEKATAFKGFTLKALPQLFVAIARYKEINMRSPIKAELHEHFQKVINMYREMIPQFNDFVNQMRPEDQGKLRQYYSA
ncbi:armadillo-type protein [Colletotrichum godetiae]|uniref:Armadillo-type protein n=1 Tax=Colletotrichum godetiae TaxID=1209918 RepID=A0AAJ0A7J7_9PEZI|nr:armadillo-type protein [Colletotrichum godetiae]KAK1656516.1 armadillo-type protein [Colletotrichum godetiae]